MKNFKYNIQKIGQWTIATILIIGFTMFTLQLFQDLATIQPNIQKILSK